MRKGLKAVLIVIAILIAIAWPVISSYNNLVTLDQDVKLSEGNIDTQLQRRSELIPNLVATVKGYAAQEKEIFTEIANARSRLAGAQNITDQANADSQLSSAISRLLVIVENYPELRSSKNFQDLTTALESAENRIARARQVYNEAVDIYNTRVRRFPGSIVAGIFRFSERPYYKASEGAREVPKVDFTQ